jgi:hypothetical protein
VADIQRGLTKAEVEAEVLPSQAEERGEAAVAVRTRACLPVPPVLKLVVRLQP